MQESFRRSIRKMTGNSVRLSVRPNRPGMMATLSQSMMVTWSIVLHEHLDAMMNDPTVNVGTSELISFSETAWKLCDSSFPQIIADGALEFGRQCIVLGMDPVCSAKCPSGYEVTTRGFREFTGMDAVEWAKRAADLGAGEIVVNSVDADGTRIGEAVGVPVVASGGAGKPEHFVEVFREANADAAIVAGMIHSGEWTISQIKDAMSAAGIPTRILRDQEAC